MTWTSIRTFPRTRSIVHQRVMGTSCRRQWRLRRILSPPRRRRRWALIRTETHHHSSPTFFWCVLLLPGVRSELGEAPESGGILDHVLGIVHAQQDMYK
jgi:hypothetical protein